jgi:transcriptional regulator with XRE-family HTH domain
MKNKIRIGECILNYRKEHRLTQGEFGELLGVSTQAVSKWERELCYPDIFLLPDISNLIGVSIDEMLKQEDI